MIIRNRIPSDCDWFVVIELFILLCWFVAGELRRLSVDIISKKNSTLTLRKSLFEDATCIDEDLIDKKKKFRHQVSRKKFDESINYINTLQNLVTMRRMNGILFLFFLSIYIIIWWYSQKPFDRCRWYPASTKFREQNRIYSRSVYQSPSGPTFFGPGSDWLKFSDPDSIGSVSARQASSVYMVSFKIIIEQWDISFLRWKKVPHCFLNFIQESDHVYPFLFISSDKNKETGYIIILRYNKNRKMKWIHMLSHYYITNLHRLRLHNQDSTILFKIISK